MLYSLSMVKSMGGIDDAFLKKLIYIFIDSIKIELEQLNKAYQDKDFAKLASKAHSMKSNIDLFCVKSIVKTIRILEDRTVLPTLTDSTISKYINDVDKTILAVIAEMEKDFPSQN